MTQIPVSEFESEVWVIEALEFAWDSGFETSRTERTLELAWDLVIEINGFPWSARAIHDLESKTPPNACLKARRNVSSSVY